MRVVTVTDALVWYVSYGSNMSAERLRCYLSGGRPSGADRTYLGARDPSPPREDRAVWLPGGVYFAYESSVWTGGMAFYDPDLVGRVPARAYLVTGEQFSDIVNQEMRRDVNTELDLADVIAEGRSQLPRGRYEVLLRVGHLDGHPMLTFTAPHGLREAKLEGPSAAYLAMTGAGLRESHGLSPRQAAEYLAGLPGAAGTWTTDQVEALCRPASVDE